MFSVAPNIVLAPNMTQNAERKHRTQNTNTAHIWLHFFCLQSHTLPTVLIPIAWKTETLMILIVLLYWFQLNPLNPKVNWCTNKSGVKDPSINTCHDTSDGKAWDCDFVWSNTILASLPERSILGKTRLFYFVTQGSMRLSLL